MVALTVRFDVSDVLLLADDLGASIDQLPYVFARSLNDAADMTRATMIELWPRYVEERNRSFIAASLTTKGARAIKDDLTVELYDRLDRGHLKLHADGGIRVPQAGRIAIPSRPLQQQRGSRGVPSNLRPRNLRADRSFVKDGKLYQITGRGRSRKARVAYYLRSSANIKKAVPFYEIWESEMWKNLIAALPGRVEQAMRTRRS